MKIIKIGNSSAIGNERIYVEIDLNPRLLMKNNVLTSDFVKDILFELKPQLNDTIEKFFIKEKEMYEATCR